MRGDAGFSRGLLPLALILLLILKELLPGEALGTEVGGDEGRELLRDRFVALLPLLPLLPAPTPPAGKMTSGAHPVETETEGDNVGEPAEVDNDDVG